MIRGVFVHRSLLVGLALAALMVPGQPAAACGAGSSNPPCGPIPVIVELTLEKTRGLRFENATEMTLHGFVSYYVDIDQNGFWYDVEKNPQLAFNVNRKPPWVDVKVEPGSYEVPVNDPNYVGQDGSAPDQLRYYWEAPVTVTITKTRDPTPEELGRDSRWIRHDGTYRVTISASSESSLLAPDVFGSNMGLQEGYGVRELRYVPEINGVPWVIDEATGELVPSDGVFPNQETGGDAPAPMGVMVGLLLVGVAAWARRRRA